MPKRNKKSSVKKNNIKEASFEQLEEVSFQQLYEEFQGHAKDPKFFKKGKSYHRQNILNEGGKGFFLLCRSKNPKSHCLITFNSNDLDNSISIVLWILVKLLNILPKALDDILTENEDIKETINDPLNIIDWFEYLKIMKPDIASYYKKWWSSGSKSLLHSAACYDKDYVKVLLKHGANPYKLSGISNESKDFLLTPYKTSPSGIKKTILSVRECLINHAHDSKQVNYICTDGSIKRCREKTISLNDKGRIIIDELTDDIGNASKLSIELSEKKINDLLKDNTEKNSNKLLNYLSKHMNPLFLLVFLLKTKVFRTTYCTNTCYIKLEIFLPNHSYQSPITGSILKKMGKCRSFKEQFDLMVTEKRVEVFSIVTHIKDLKTINYGGSQIVFSDQRDIQMYFTYGVDYLLQCAANHSIFSVTSRNKTSETTRALLEYGVNIFDHRFDMAQNSPALCLFQFGSCDKELIEFLVLHHCSDFFELALKYGYYETARKILCESKETLDFGKFCKDHYEALYDVIFTDRSDCISETVSGVHNSGQIIGLKKAKPGDFSFSNFLKVFQSSLEAISELILQRSILNKEYSDKLTASLIKIIKNELDKKFIESRFIEFILNMTDWIKWDCILSQIEIEKLTSCSIHSTELRACLKLVIPNLKSKLESLDKDQNTKSEKTASANRTVVSAEQVKSINSKLITLNESIVALIDDASEYIDDLAPYNKDTDQIYQSLP